MSRKTINNYNYVTQEYLEGLYNESRKTLELVDFLLERAIRDAKKGLAMSSSYISKDEYTYASMVVACEKIKDRGIHVNWSKEYKDSPEGYVGEVQIYFYDTLREDSI